MQSTPIRLVAALGTSAFLGACASFSPDGGMDAVSAMSQERVGAPVLALRTEDAQRQAGESVNNWLKKPLDPDIAVRIALLNSRALQASLSELGIVEADLVQAGRLRNPGFSFGRLRHSGNVEIERAVMFDLIGILAIPLRASVERERFEQAKLSAAAAAVSLAADTRRAYFNAVAAAQTARYMEQMKEAAEAGAELGRRMARVGNWSKLDYAREQAFYADATAQLARARHQELATREQLARLLGLQHHDFKLPERLPDLPKQLLATQQAEADAMRQRLDLKLALHKTKMTARALGLTRATGFVNVLHAGTMNVSETGEARANGYEIELELPLFDWGGAKRARAQAVYMQAVHRSADVAVRARSQVREAYSAYRTSFDLARHYRDEIVPLRQRISEEMLLRYNGMLIGIFDLLADARTQIVSVNAAIEAQRDFWLADTDLQQAINGSGGAALQMRAAAPAAQAKDH